jgi:hypothetical protein
MAEALSLAAGLARPTLLRSKGYLSGFLTEGVIVGIWSQGPSVPSTDLTLIHLFLLLVSYPLRYRHRLLINC